MTKLREIVQEIVVLYINTESYGMTNHREMVKLVKEKEDGDGRLEG